MRLTILNIGLKMKENERQITDMDGNYYKTSTNFSNEDSFNT